MSALQQALERAHALLDEDDRTEGVDAGALRELVEAVEAPGSPHAKLRRTIASASAHTAEMSGDRAKARPSHEWAAVAKCAAEALAALDDEHEGGWLDAPAGEREHLAAMLREAQADERVLRGQLDTASREVGIFRTQRDGLAVFLDTLATEFEAASTPTATRVAQRIRVALEDVGHNRAQVAADLAGESA